LVQIKFDTSAILKKFAQSKQDILIAMAGNLLIADIKCVLQAVGQLTSLFSFSQLLY
jgi:hypothetical protein